MKCRECGRTLKSVRSQRDGIGLCCAKKRAAKLQMNLEEKGDLNKEPVASLQNSGYNETKEGVQKNG